MSDVLSSVVGVPLNAPPVTSTLDCARPLESDRVISPVSSKRNVTDTVETESPEMLITSAQIDVDVAVNDAACTFAFVSDNAERDRMVASPSSPVPGP